MPNIYMQMVSHCPVIACLPPTPLTTLYISKGLRKPTRGFLASMPCCLNLPSRSLLSSAAFKWNVCAGRKRLICEPLQIDLNPPLETWKEPKERPTPR